jgi:hypothetical protein
MAFRAAALNDAGALLIVVAPLDSRMVTTPGPCLGQGNKSGLSVATTKRIARQTVTDWENMSQSLCISFVNV